MRELRRFRPQLLQTFLFHANIAGRIAGKLARVPRIVSGIRVAERRSRWHLLVDRYTNWMVDGNVCVSQAVAEFSVHAGLDRHKTVVIGNGVEVAPIAMAEPLSRATLGLPADARILLSLGRLDHQKGYSYLLDALPPLVREFEDLHVLLVGEGPAREELTTQIAENQLQKRVHLLGWRDDVPRLLKTAEVFVSSSLWEGLPNAVLEAMAAGLPIVATSVEGSSELLGDGQMGRLVPPRSPDALREALEWVLRNPAAAGQWGEVARSRVTTDWTWESICEKYAGLYRSLLRLPSGQNAPPGNDGPLKSES
jgi:starch synthase (maltosyl-transferring)